MVVFACLSICPFVLSQLDCHLGAFADNPMAVVDRLLMVLYFFFKEIYGRSFNNEIDRESDIFLDIVMQDIMRGYFLMK